METTAPEFIDEHRATDEDKLTVIRERAAYARDLESQINDLEERLSSLKNELYHLYHKELVDLMDEAGIDHIGLPAEGNYPAMDARLLPHYHASIGADWPPERRELALRTLEKYHAGDLIKTEVSILFPREEHSRVIAFLNWLADLKLTAVIKETVHHKTLTAWLREQVERHRPLPALEDIGATVGRIVKLKERKD